MRKAREVFVCVIIGLVSVAAAQQPDSAVLTNKDVLQMVGAGLGPDVIVAKIKRSKCRFETSAGDLSDLKKANVPDPILVAMVEAPFTFINPMEKIKVRRDDKGNILPGGPSYLAGKKRWLSSDGKHNLVVAAWEEKKYLIVDLFAVNAGSSAEVIDPKKIVATDMLANAPLKKVETEELAQKSSHPSAGTRFRCGAAAGMMANRSDSSYGTVTDPQGRVIGNVDITTSARDSAYEDKLYQDCVAASMGSAANAATSSLYLTAVKEGESTRGLLFFERPSRENLKQHLGIDDKGFVVEVTVEFAGDKFAFIFPIELLERMKAN
jgi:hypothetical protein